MKISGVKYYLGKFQNILNAQKKNKSVFINYLRDLTRPEGEEGVIFTTSDIHKEYLPFIENISSLIPPQITELQTYNILGADLTNGATPD